MKLNIPPLDTKLRLVESWSFELPNFHWNRNFWVSIFGPETWDLTIPRSNDPRKSQLITLPAGTILVVTRIDFRPDDPYEVRFHLTRANNPYSVAYGRFWVSRQAANHANLEAVS